MGILDELVEASARRAAALPPRTTDAVVARRSFASAIAGRDRMHVIAEFKRCSPSQGVIRSDAQVSALVTAYAEGGASALSVLTEPTRFQGRDADVLEAARAVDLPILNKDFLVTPRQLEHAVDLGASAILLIVRCLAESQLRELATVARSLGLTSLVECHDASEIAVALSVEDAVIGINQRDLGRMTIDPERGRRLLSAVPEDRVVVVESGVSDPAEIVALTGQADAVLVGTALMRAPDPRAFLAAARGDSPRANARGGAV